MFLKVAFLSVVSIIFIGCGSSSLTDESLGMIEDTNSNNTYTVINSDKDKSSVSKYTGKASENLIAKSIDGVLENVTYICVGDSTRVASQRDHQEVLFNDLNRTLSNDNVDVYLLARGGHMLLEFIDGSKFPTYMDVVDKIPGDGSTSIVEFSLGINDLFDYKMVSRDQIPEVTAIIKERLIRAVELIKESKPKTTVVLVSPNPLKDWQQGTQTYMDAYKEVSKELNLEFINFSENIMPDPQSSEWSEWYIDGVHFSEYALHKVAEYILAYLKA